MESQPSCTSGEARWQLQDAKQRFSELIRRAESRPQLVTRHGEDIAVVVSMEEYLRTHTPRPPLKDFLMNGPDLSLLEIERPHDLPREPDL